MFLQPLGIVLERVLLRKFQHTKICGQFINVDITFQQAQSSDLTQNGNKRFVAGSVAGTCGLQILTQKSRVFQWNATKVCSNVCLAAQVFRVLDQQDTKGEQFSRK